MGPENTKVVLPNQKPLAQDKKVAAPVPPADGDREQALGSKADRVNEARRMSRFNLATVLTVALVVALMLVAYPTFIVFAVGMAPTFVGNITQLERNSYRYIALASLNFAGVMPYILDLWQQGHKIEVALRIVTDPNALLIMYGAAALAVSLFWAAPQIAASFLTVVASRKVSSLKKDQESLIQEWGPDVDASATPASE